MERGSLRAAAGERAAASAGGVRGRAAALAARYDELLAEAELTAVRWRWATPTSGFGDVEPLRLERMGCSPGHWLGSAPPPWREHEAIGLDALDRVVCVRQYDATGEVWLERFARWSRDLVEVACFRAPLEDGGALLAAELQSVLRMRLDPGGLPAESERYLPPTGSCARERYRHQGGRLTRVEEDSCDDGGGLQTVVKEVVYGEDGQVMGVDALGPDGRRAVWRRDGGQPHTARRAGARSATGRFRRQVCA
jgi:hypothetical protein